MKSLRFEDYEEFSTEIVKAYGMLHDGSVSIVASDYEEAKIIFKELLGYGYDVANITLTDPLWAGYEDEFVITLYGNEITIEEAKSEDGDYLNGDDDVVFISSNANSKLVKCYESCDAVYEFFIGDDEPVNIRCKNCDECDSCVKVVVDGKELHGSDKYAAIAKALKHYQHTMDMFDRFMF